VHSNIIAPHYLTHAPVTAAGLFPLPAGNGQTLPASTGSLPHAVKGWWEQDRYCASGNTAVQQYTFNKQ